MRYIEGKIHTSIQGIELVFDLLTNMGITGAVVNNPDDIADLLDKKNVYDWDYIDQSVLDLRDEEPSVTFYIEDGEEGRNLLTEIQQSLMKLKSDELYGVLGAGVDLGRLYCETQTLEDADYLNNWKEFFKPAKITDRLVVKPSWEAYEPAENELVIELDPGQAFGTGTHETTSLCLKLMEKYGVEGKTVLDVGCGSGILAAAAGLLGASEVLGIDIDPVAVRTGQENIEKNHLEGLVRIVEGDLTKGVNFAADVVMANLMADLVVMLSADVGKHMKADGIYISSGILVEKRNLVAVVIEQCGFQIIEVLEDGQWCAIAAKKENSKNI